MENKTYQYKRITVKIGSNVLTRRDGTLDITRMSALVDQVAELQSGSFRKKRVETLAETGQRGPAAAFLGSGTG